MQKDTQPSTAIFERLTSRPSFVIEARLARPKKDGDHSWLGRDYGEDWMTVGEVTFSDMRLWTVEKIGFLVEKMTDVGFHGYADGREWEYRITELARLADGNIVTPADFYPEDDQEERPELLTPEQDERNGRLNAIIVRLDAIIVKLEALSAEQLRSVVA